MEGEEFVASASNVIWSSTDEAIEMPASCSLAMKPVRPIIRVGGFA